MPNRPGPKGPPRPVNQYQPGQNEVGDPVRLLRELQDVRTKLYEVEARIRDVGGRDLGLTTADFARVQQELSSQGGYPLNLSGLIGRAGESQFAYFPIVTSLPDAKTDLRRAVALKTGTKYYLHIWIDGVPPKWIDISSTLGLPTNVAFIDAVNTFTVNQIFNGRFTTYNNDLVVGNGVTGIVGLSAQTGKTASIGATTLFTPAATGEYRVSYYISTTTAGAGNVITTVNWTDENGAKNIASAAMNLTAGNFQQATYLVHSGASAIQFSTTYAATGTYQIYVIVERLS